MSEKVAGEKPKTARNERLNVIAAWKELFKHLGTEHTRRPDELINDQSEQKEIAERDQCYYRRLYDNRQRFLAKLLHAIAKNLDFRVEQLEIFDPQGWSDIELEQSAIRRFAVDLYLGRRMLPVGVVDYVRPSLPETERVQNQRNEKTA